MGGGLFLTVLFYFRSLVPANLPFFHFIYFFYWGGAISLSDFVFSSTKHEQNLFKDWLRYVCVTGIT